MVTYSSILGLENPLGRGACQATVHRVAWNLTHPSDRHTCIILGIYYLLISA